VRPDETRTQSDLMRPGLSQTRSDGTRTSTSYKRRHLHVSLDRTGSPPSASEHFVYFVLDLKNKKLKKLKVDKCDLAVTASHQRCSSEEDEGDEEVEEGSSLRVLPSHDALQ